MGPYIPLSSGKGKKERGKRKTASSKGQTMTKPPSILLSLAALARAAGAEIMRIRARGYDVRGKADSSPVTEADEAAEAIILRGLAGLFPGIPVIAEEEAAAGRMPAIGERFLLVDPLDGTKSFIAGREDFTVNIALVEKGEPVTGIVFAPARRWLLAGSHEAGAWQAKDDAPLTLINPAPPHEALRAVASLNHRHARTDAWLAEHGITDIIAAGSSLKLCLLATGEADVYPRFGPTMEWDIAAGHAVLAAAGGRVLKVSDGRPLTYGKAEEGFLNPPFIAWAPGREPFA